MPEIAQLNGVLVLFEGIAGILCVIASAFWGRRYVAFLSLSLEKKLAHKNPGRRTSSPRRCSF